MGVPTICMVCATTPPTTPIAMCDQVLKFARDVEATERALNEHEIVGMAITGPAEDDVYVCSCGNEYPAADYVRHQASQVVLALLEGHGA
jgi:hypothetical protein